MSEVRLTKAPTFELDPNKRYIIQLKQGALQDEDILRFAKELKRLNIKAVCVVLPEGKSLKIIEAKP